VVHYSPTALSQLGSAKSARPVASLVNHRSPALHGDTSDFYDLAASPVTSDISAGKSCSPRHNPEITIFVSVYNNNI